MTDSPATDPFDKAAAMETHIAEANELREKHRRSYSRPAALGSSVSFFVTLVLLLPLHWMVPHDMEWLLITHMVLLAIVGGQAVRELIEWRAKKSLRDGR